MGKPRARTRSGRRRTTLKVRSLDIPVPPGKGAEQPTDILVSRLGSRDAARRAILAVAQEFGASDDLESVSAAIALTKLGADLGRIADSLDWREFEDYCGMTLSASGYGVRRNVRLRKPPRQIDIIAESAVLVLSIDCKHWRRGTGPGGLFFLAEAQAERTRKYGAEMSKRGEGRPILPMLLTMLDNQVRVVGGVPIVPLQSLRAFLSSVSRFDEELSFIPTTGTRLQ
jgi:Restriction endonuclease